MIKLILETDDDHVTALNGLAILMDIAGLNELDDPNMPVNVMIDAFADAVDQYEKETVDMS